MFSTSAQNKQTRERISITIKPDLLTELDRRVNEGDFQSRSHIVSIACREYLRQLVEIEAMNADLDEPGAD